MVIGGGLLGLEAANGLMLRGMKTSVVHIMPWLMERQLDRTAVGEPRVGDSDDGAEMARLLVIRRRPHRIIMVTRVGGIDGEERQRAQILSFAK